MRDESLGGGRNSRYDDDKFEDDSEDEKYDESAEPVLARVKNTGPSHEALHGSKNGLTEFTE